MAITTIDEALTQATIPLQTAAQLFFGLSRNAAYEAAKRGDFETIRVGGKIVVPVAPLAARFGLQMNIGSQVAHGEPTFRAAPLGIYSAASETEERVGKPRTLTVRLTEAQHTRLHEASTFGPYRVPITEIVIRGIELAAQELETMATRPRLADQMADEMKRENAA